MKSKEKKETKVNGRIEQKREQLWNLQIYKEE